MKVSLSAEVLNVKNVISGDRVVLTEMGAIGIFAISHAASTCSGAGLSLNRNIFGEHAFLADLQVTVTPLLKNGAARRDKGRFDIKVLADRQLKPISPEDLA